MTESEALHTVTRRYCMERLAELEVLIAKVWKWGIITDESAQAPRSFVLREIQIAIERIVPMSIDLEECRELLIDAALHTQNDITSSKRWRDGGGQSKTQIERTLLANYIRSLTVEVLNDVKPLPYRRFLIPSESATLHDRMQVRWRIDRKQWIPDRPIEFAGDILVVHIDDFSKFIGSSAIKQILSDHDVHKVFRICSDSDFPDCELHISSFETTIYWGHYWTSDSMDWVIYVSEQWLVTIAGDWLIPAIKALWPSWSEHPYVRHPYIPPPSIQKAPPTEDEKHKFKLSLGLTLAVETDDIPKIESLLSQGISVNHQAKSGYSILHRAAAGKSTEAVRFLIQRGADVNMITNGGVTPLMEAVINARVDIVQLLIDSGADIAPHAFDLRENGPKAGLSALEIAEHSDYLSLLENGRRREIIIALLKAAQERSNR